MQAQVVRSPTLLNNTSDFGKMTNNIYATIGVKIPAENLPAGKGYRNPIYSDGDIPLQG